MNNQIIDHFIQTKFYILACRLVKALHSSNLVKGIYLWRYKPLHSSDLVKEILFSFRSSF